MTDNQMNVPTYPEDHDRFKKMAATKKMSMKDLFHELITPKKEKK
jgi:hypothetical protein